MEEHDFKEVPGPPPSPILPFVTLTRIRLPGSFRINGTGFPAELMTNQVHNNNYQYRSYNNYSESLFKTHVFALTCRYLRGQTMDLYPGYFLVSLSFLPLNTPVPVKYRIAVPMTIQITVITIINTALDIFYSLFTTISLIFLLSGIFSRCNNRGRYPLPGRRRL